MAIGEEMWLPLTYIEIKTLMTREYKFSLSSVSPLAFGVGAVKVNFDEGGLHCVFIDTKGCMVIPD
jgi:hypothetical protein